MTQKITVQKHSPDLVVDQADSTQEPQQKEGSKPAESMWNDLIQASDLIEKFPEMRPYIIEGILRRGEVFNLIAASKVGKSWLAIYTLIAIANGLPWFGFQTKAAKVLLIDNELHSETLSHRFRFVRAAMASSLAYQNEKVTLENIAVKTLRGRCCDIKNLAVQSLDLADDGFGVICIDALYRMLPEGASENSNEDMTQVYSAIDQIAYLTGASVVVVHHSSKGDQSGKKSIETGSGAGAIGRAADSHLTVRDHAEKGLSVLDFNIRSSPPMQARTAKFSWPLWELSEKDPVLARPKSANDIKAEERDRESRAQLLTTFQSKPGKKIWTASELRGATGFGDSRVIRGLSLLNGKVGKKTVKSKKSKRKVDGYFLKNEG